jgi:hypothetical protein
LRFNIQCVIIYLSGKPKEKEDNMSYDEACGKAWTWWASHMCATCGQFQEVIAAIAKKYDKDFYDVRENVFSKR